MTDRPASDDLLPPGASVEVLSEFTKRWTGGFVIEDVSRDGYRLRRLSDSYVLPTVFDPAAIRASS